LAGSRREEAVDSLVADLRRLGIDPAGEPAKAVEALREMIGARPDQDLEIARFLGRIEDPTAVGALVSLEERAKQVGDKPTAKAARRSLYRLSQRGVPTPPRQAIEGSPIHRGLAPVPNGFLSPIDATGGRLVWITRAAVGGTLLLSATINEPLGMEDVSLGETTAKQLRAIRKELAEKHGLRLVEADWRYVDSLCQQAFERASRRASEADSQFPAFRRRLTGETALPLSQAPVYALLDARAIAADSLALDRSRTLFEEPEMMAWILPTPLRESRIEELREVTNSPLVLSAQHKRERLEELAAKWTREAFVGEWGSAYVRRLEEMSYYFLQTGRRAQAEAALAAALALARSGAGGAENPFCEQMVKRTIDVMLFEDQEKERERAASSVLIRPGMPEAIPRGAAVSPARTILKP